MIVDCESCPIRGAACDSCVIGLLLSAPFKAHATGAGDAGGATADTGAPSADQRPVDPARVDPAGERQRALRRLGEAGLVRVLGAAPESPIRRKNAG